MPAALCLTCASSLPSKTLEADGVFRTSCCQRPICFRCLSRNPRLRAYNPCLACLAGVDATSSSASSSSVNRHLAVRGGGTDGMLDSKSGLEVNGVMENDMFTIGNSDEEDDKEERGEEAEGEDDEPSSYRAADSLPPPYSTLSPSSFSESHNHLLPTPVMETPPLQSSSPPGLLVSTSDPTKYYIQPGDTLSAISLRLGIDGRRLARLNNLPPSTLTTTPHLLHTRRFLTLPANARVVLSSISNAPQPTEPDATAEQEQQMKAKRERERARERAEKRFAFVTKEVDYRVAKAYVAIADEFGDSSGSESGNKLEEGTQDEKKNITKSATKDLGSASTSALGRNTESRAVDRYLEDEEWEQNELRAGRQPRLPSFPFSRS